MTKLLSWSSTSCQKLGRGRSWSSLRPYWASRRAASSPVNPSWSWLRQVYDDVVDPHRVPGGAHGIGGIVVQHHT